MHAWEIPYSLNFIWRRVGCSYEVSYKLLAPFMCSVPAALYHELKARGDLDRVFRSTRHQLPSCTSEFTGTPRWHHKQIK